MYDQHSLIFQLDELRNLKDDHGTQLLKETELRANDLDATKRAYAAALEEAKDKIDELEAKNAGLRPFRDRAEWLQTQVDILTPQVISLKKKNVDYYKQLCNGKFAENTQPKSARLISIVCRKKKFKKSAHHEKYRRRASLRNLRQQRRLAERRCDRIKTNAAAFSARSS